MRAEELALAGLHIAFRERVDEAGIRMEGLKPLKTSPEIR
jgi:hypothetical protein